MAAADGMVGKSGFSANILRNKILRK